MNSAKNELDNMIVFRVYLDNRQRCYTQQNIRALSSCDLKVKSQGVWGRMRYAPNTFGDFWCQKSPRAGSALSFTLSKMLLWEFWTATPPRLQ